MSYLTSVTLVQPFEQALDAVRAVGRAGLRCAHRDRHAVHAVDPATLVTLTDNEELGEVATRLAAAMDALGPAEVTGFAGRPTP